jgi:hypothetical protein
VDDSEVEVECGVGGMYDGARARELGMVMYGGLTQLDAEDMNKSFGFDLKRLRVSPAGWYYLIGQLSSASRRQNSESSTLTTSTLTVLAR